MTEANPVVGVDIDDGKQLRRAKLKIRHKNQREIEFYEPKREFPDGAKL